MFIREIIEWLQQEGEVIRKAPVAFLMVCLVATGVIWECFHVIYEDKLSDAHELIDHWKGDADYWKDMSSHPVVEIKPSAPANRTLNNPQIGNPQETKPMETIHPSNGSTKRSAPTVDHASPPIQPSQVVGQNTGVIIGGNNSGTATVNNIGRVPRSLNSLQAMMLGTALGLPDPNFDGITAIMGDPESLRFAEEIRSVFAAHGWPQSAGLTQAVYTGVMPGILIGISPDDATSTPDPRVMSIYNAFRSNGFDVHATVVKGMAKGHFSIIVGSDVQGA